MFYFNNVTLSLLLLEREGRNPLTGPSVMKTDHPIKKCSKKNQIVSCCSWWHWYRGQVAMPMAERNGWHLFLTGKVVSSLEHTISEKCKHGQTVNSPQIKAPRVNSLAWGLLTACRKHGCHTHGRSQGAGWPGEGACPLPPLGFQKLNYKR